MADALVLSIEHVLQFITFLILIWAWLTFFAYINSSRKLLSTEFKKIVIWVMTGILFFAIRTTFELLAYLLMATLSGPMLIVLNIFSFSSAFSFMVSAYHLLKFSRKYGFAERLKKLGKPRPGRPKRKRR